VTACRSVRIAVGVVLVCPTGVRRRCVVLTRQLAAGIVGVVHRSVCGTGKGGQTIDLVVLPIPIRQYDGALTVRDPDQSGGVRRIGTSKNKVEGGRFSPRSSWITPSPLISFSPFVRLNFSTNTTRVIPAAFPLRQRYQAMDWRQ